ncbi:hypothetical protein CQW31_09150 [Pseudomonas sp. 382]|nr:hypothetical protein CQW31_09150 [Pseudomonas sp. 382]
MPKLRVSMETFAETLLTKGQSTFLLACVLDLRTPDDVIDVVICETGQEALDLLNSLDRPNAHQAIVGVQLALPPRMNKAAKWVVHPVLDFTRVTMDTGKDHIDTYAYRIASGKYFADNQEVKVEKIMSVRSIYQASNAGSQSDAELSAFQAWIAKILDELINESSIPS